MKFYNMERFRRVGIYEGISYLALFGVTMPLKYIFEIKWPNYVVGMAHGFLFILYIWFTYLTMRKYKLSLLNTFYLVIASLLPFGTFVTDKKILSKLA